MSNENSTIIAFLFSHAELSSEIYEGIHRLHNDGGLQVKDVCEFEVKENGKLKFERAMLLPLLGSGDEIFLEAFAGLLYFHAPHSETVKRAIEEMNLDLNFVESIREASAPGTSVLFVRAEGRVEEKAVQKLGLRADRVLMMSLSQEQESKLEILFHGGQTTEQRMAEASLH